MNIKIFLSTLVMGLCAIACSDDNVSETEKQQEGKPTYVNLSVSLPGRTTSRALPGDYNNDGTYEAVSYTHLRIFSLSLLLSLLFPASSC